MSQLSSRNWFGRASAGAILGFTLSITFSLIFTRALQSDDPLFVGPRVIGMWMIPLFWSVILSLSFLFRTGRRAWGWLAAGNAAAWAIYAALHIAMG